MNQNQKDKAMYNDIEVVYNESALTINRITEEIVNLQEKFGTSSKIVETKKNQLAQIRRLYDKTLSYINYLRELNHSMYNEFMFIEMERHKKEMGLSYQQLAVLSGKNPKEWEKIDKLDRVIASIKTKLKLEEPNEFERFINELKDNGS